MLKFLLDNYKEKVLDVKDLHGYNILTYAVQEFSWECLSEIINMLGQQALDVSDENVPATPSQFAKLIGYENAYQKWLDSHLSGDKIDWNEHYKEQEAMTAIMFHGIIFIHNYHL